MKRFSVLKATILLAVAALAIRYALATYALSSATFGLGGSYAVGGTGNRLVSCTLDTPTLSVNRPQPANQTRTVRGTVTCVNNLPSDVTLNVSATNGRLSPTRTTPPGVTVIGASIAGKSAPAQVIIEFAVTKNTTAGPATSPYVYTFDISGSTSPAAMDYDKVGFSISLEVK